MTTRTAAEFSVLILLLILSAFFSSSETALTTANRIRIRTSAEQGKKNAAVLLKILEEPEKMLSVILIGNNIVNLYASSLATSLTIRVFGSQAVGAATGILTLAVLVFGEVTPKTLAARNAEKIALSAAGAIRFLMVVLSPAVFLVNTLAGGLLKLLRADAPGKNSSLTTKELKTIVEVGHEEGVIKKEERELIDNVFDFGGTLTRDIMVPRIDMVCIDENADFEEFMKLFRKEKYTRIPVCRGSADTIVGILNVKDLLLRDPSRKFAVRDYMREALFTYEQKKTSELMVEMRKHFTNIAIVLDDFGVTAGMITMEDILEEIVGEIHDEYDTDEEKPIRRVSAEEYLVDGTTRLTDLNDALGLHLESDDYESLGGLVLGLLDHIPKKGESVDSGGIRFTVDRMDRKRIARVRMRLPAARHPEAEAAKTENRGQ